MRARAGIVLVLAACVMLPAGQVANAHCVKPKQTVACAAEQEYAVGLLRGVVVPHHGRSYRRPGYSSLKVVSSPEAAYITVSEPTTHVHKQWLTSERENNVVTVPWSCKRPRQSFHYAITARGEVGVTVTAHATFHAELTKRWCAAAKHREEAERAAKRRHEAELREARRREVESREAHRREAEREAAREREQPTHCSNGTYVNSSGNTVCKPERSPEGPPAGATAKCEDGTYSFSEHHSGTCSGHGGVAEWLS